MVCPKLTDSARRTMVLARSASYAPAFIDRGPEIAVFPFHHSDGICRTMACATAAFLPVCRRNADRKVYLCRAGFDGGFFGLVYGSYGSRGAHLAATGAFRATEAVGKSHDGLHDAVERYSGFQYFIGALAYTQLACGAVIAEVLKAYGSGRNSRNYVFAALLLF